MTTFRKPLCEKTSYEEPPLLLSPVRKTSLRRRSRKGIQTPPDTDDEKLIRHTRLPRSFVHEEKFIYHKQEEAKKLVRKRRARIYSEETEVK